VLRREVVRRITRSTLLSFVFFYPAVIVILSLIVRSAVYASIAIIPSATTVLFALGVMGYTGGIPRSAIMSICLAALMGVAMDDSVLFVLFYRRHLAKHGTAVDAATETLGRHGTVIIRTSVIIVMGLSVLLFSRYVPMVRNGLLMMSGFVVSTFGALFAIPALLVRASRRKEGAS